MPLLLMFQILEINLDNFMIDSLLWVYLITCFGRIPQINPWKFYMSKCRVVEFHFEQMKKDMSPLVYRNKI